ncbi:MAG: molybdopterin-binding protein, partial [Kiloniellales bacterium]
MHFGPVKIDEAEGAILAHSLKAGKATFRKGRRLSPADLAALAEAGVTEVIAAVLEAGDVHEDEAAAKLAQAICGSGLLTTPAFTGRSNLKASAPGLLVPDGARLDALNEIDESITVATVPALAPLEAGQMVATVKIIPFAAPQVALDKALAVASGEAALLRLAPFRARRTGLVQTRLPGMKESLLEKTSSALDARLARLGSPPAEERRVAHRAEAVSGALKELAAEGCDLLLVSGASAVVDRRDVVPAGIVAAGGAIDHFGMPVDPGNLLLLGHIGTTPAIGLPGCARSPNENGFDWVLARLLADLPVTRREVMRMGGGGLLTEIGSRPLPRAEAVKRADPTARQAAPKVAALLL